MSYVNLILAILFGLTLFGSILMAIGRRQERHYGKRKWKVKVENFSGTAKVTNDEASNLLSGLNVGNLIGFGRSGMVFDAKIGGEVKIAVKKVRRMADDEENSNLVKDFEAEKISLSMLRHPNIVKLHGCIYNHDRMQALIYEHIENGNLHEWLHTNKGFLGWQPRILIATDIANGLSYIHNFIVSIIHRDIKPSNILLDNQFRAKIADFGLALIISKVGESKLVSAIGGTFGYIAPEHAANGTVSEKTDVYSFGVILLELVTGKQSVFDASGEQVVSLAEWAEQQMNNMPKVTWDDIIDKGIKNSGHLKDIKTVFMLGLSCTDRDPGKRPAMNEVVEQLLQCDPNRVKHGGKKTTVTVTRKIINWFVGAKGF